MQRESEFARVLGKVIDSIARIFYEYKGQIDPSDGAVELRFRDHSALLLDGAGNGESLRMSWATWRDPFAPPLTDENAIFVREHGKWTRVDVSREGAYQELVGKSIIAAVPLFNEFGSLGGVKLVTDSRTMWFVVEFDEYHIRWTHPEGFHERPSPEGGVRFENES